VQEQTYTYQIASVFNLNPTNPNSPFIETELSDEVEIKISFVGVNDRVSRQYSLYPNPTTGTLAVSFAGQSIQGEAKVSVTDIRGVNIFSAMLNDNRKVLFDLSSVESGVYFVIIRVNGAVYTEKVIKY
jgi:hypothetical protein